MRKVSTFIKGLFRKELDLRVRIFNMLAIGGVLISLVTLWQNIAVQMGAASIVINVLAAGLSVFLLVYSAKSQRYQLCYTVTILVVFFGMFAMLFLTGGGYHGGMPSFFIFAVVYTAYMLDGKKVYAIALLELAFYAGLCLYAYRNPESIVSLSSERVVLQDVVVCVLIVSIALGATMYAQVRLYRAQQRRVDEQNAVLAQANQSKTQFLANISHEMRTPLTVISVDIQTAMGLLERMDGVAQDAEPLSLLRDAQTEIMRLSRMAGSMLSLNALADNTEKRRLDFSALLQGAAGVMHLTLRKQGNELQTDIPEHLAVFGSADLLTQVIVNLLQNANAHTKGGAISLRAAEGGGVITATVVDNGSGIPPELLPRVFERGVSSGGTGVGLFLCKTVVESHGGAIAIESEPGAGTAVTFTLPVYQGQFGGDEHEG